MLSKEKSLIELEQVFRRVFRKKISEWNKNVERDLSGSQALILESLHREGKRKATELAETLDITAGAITALCDKMVTAELVKRKRAKDDRRVVYIEITTKGLQALEQVRQLRAQMVERMYGELSENDIQQLIRIYNMVLINLDKEGDL